MITHNVRKKSIVDRFLDFLVNNNQTLALLLTAFVVASGLFFGRQWWLNYQNKEAQRYFGTLIIEYNRALQDASTDWDALRVKFEKGFERHGRSTMLPYYKNYVVHILLQQAKQDEAAALLDTIIADTKGSSLHTVYMMERALLDLDSGDSERQSAGENALRALAQDTKNQFRDTAQFYLGRYYWSMDRLAQAREIWQQLVDEQADEKIAPSPWVQQAQEYLSVIIV